MDTIVDKALNSIGFSLQPSNDTYVYLWDQGDERYALLTLPGGLGIPTELHQRVVVVLYEWIGDLCYERWAGTYTSLKNFLIDAKAGKPWETHPQCWTDGCRNAPANSTSGLCKMCKSKAN